MSLKATGGRACGKHIAALWRGRMKVWVDADACPGVVREIILRAAERRQVPTVFVANRALSLPESPFITFVPVAATPDAADHHIATHAQPGDLVVTQDIPLASELVSNGVFAINPHGTPFTAANIGERLASRDLMQGLRDTGLITGGPAAYGDKDKRTFANTFDRELTRLLKV